MGEIIEASLLEYSQVFEEIKEFTSNYITFNMLPRWLGGKESAYNAGDVGSIPGLGRSPWGRHGNPLQYSCWENPQGQRRLGGCSRTHWETKHRSTGKSVALTVWASVGKVRSPTKCNHLCAQSLNLTLCDLMDCSLPDNSRLEYWSKLLFSIPGYLPGPGIKPASLCVS